MVRGIFFYVLVWVVVAMGLYIFSRLTKNQRLTLFRCAAYGLGTATLALCIVLLVVYLF